MALIHGLRTLTVPVASALLAVACNDASLGEKPDDTDGGSDSAGTNGATDSSADTDGTSAGTDSGDSAGTGGTSDSGDSGDTGGDTGTPLDDPCLDGIAPDSWQSITTEGAPQYSSLAWWTGSRLLVIDQPADLSGATYDVCADTWTPISTPTFLPEDGGFYHDWTGQRLVVWSLSGMYSSAGGAIYDPSEDTWTPMNMTGAPAQTDFTPSRTIEHIVVGDTLLVMSGDLRPVDGAETFLWAYDLEADAWEARSIEGSPPPRMNYALTRAGSRALLYGGWEDMHFHDGGLYDPAADAWEAIPDSGASLSLSTTDTLQVWTGDRFLAWAASQTIPTGEQDGRIYDPGAIRWDPITPAGAPPYRRDGARVFTGDRLAFFGGSPAPDAEPQNAIYDLDANAWSPIPDAGAPAGMLSTAAGLAIDPGRVFVHSVEDSPPKIYDADGNAWTDIATAGAPPLRYGYHAFWTGGRVILWGGAEEAPCKETNCKIIIDYFNVGAMYRP